MSYLRNIDDRGRCGKVLDDGVLGCVHVVREMTGPIPNRDGPDRPERRGGLSVFVTNQGSSSILTVGGEIDMDTAPSLRDRLDMLTERGRGDVFVDMSEVTFCGSTGLAVLVAAFEALRTQARVLRVVNPSIPVERLLRLVRLEHLLSET